MGFTFLTKGNIKAKALSAGKRYRSWILVGSIKKPKKRMKAEKRISISPETSRRLYKMYRVKPVKAPNIIQPIKKEACVSGCHIPPKAHVLNAFIGVKGEA